VSQLAAILGTRKSSWYGDASFRRIRPPRQKVRSQVRQLCELVAGRLDLSECAVIQMVNKAIHTYEYGPTVEAKLNIPAESKGPSGG
jgi:hypothetical protein